LKPAATGVYAHTYSLPNSPFGLHLGLIPDGGRRWAVKAGCSLSSSYELSATKILLFLDLAIQHGYGEISVYLLSAENLSRDPSEIKDAADAIYMLSREMMPWAQKREAIVRTVGDLTVVPTYVSDSVWRLQEKTQNNRALAVNLLIGYSAFVELSQAASGRDHELDFDFARLSIPTKVDTIIRTGGMTMLSGFLPLQSTYAHIVTVDELFNDITDEQIEKILTRDSRIVRLNGK